MKLKAYLIYDEAVVIQPASTERTWMAENPTIYQQLPLEWANSNGWNLLCPYSFSARWNGGNQPQDIEINVEGLDSDSRPLIASRLGNGLLTFETGYQFKTEGAHHLWIRGPVNQPKDGMYPLDTVIDVSQLPVTVTMQWKFTRPNTWVHFEQGEPFATLLPYPHNYIEQFTGEVVELEENLGLPSMSHDDPEIQAIIAELKGKAPQSEWAEKLTRLPAISCICLTYGRTDLLEEAIFSFLRQDYPGQKELIILNDYEEQTLEFAHPEIQIFNVPKRFKTVGEKYKAATALCSHDLIFVWHDDDIYLPHRLSFCVNQMTKGFFKGNKAWLWNNGELSGPEGNNFHGGSCWTRELFQQMRGYPHVNNTYDIDFEGKIQTTNYAAFQVCNLQAEEIYYIYRWNGTKSYHLSASDYQKVADYVRGEAERGAIKQGHIQLEPHWNQDYVTMVQSYLKSIPKVQTPIRDMPFPPPFFEIPPPPSMPEIEIAGLFQRNYPLKLSVILPTLNDSVLLKRTVEQFQATLPDQSEIIVVDNGSADGSSDFLLQTQPDKVHLIRTDHPLGVAGARNRGLEVAQGEVVVFADAHIDVPQNWWQPVVATLNQPHVGVIGPAIGVMGQPDYPKACGQRVAEPNLRLEWLPHQKDEPHQVPTLGGGFMAMRHDTLKVAGAFDGGMPHWGSEDLEICLRYWFLGYEVWVVPQVVILHYFRSQNSYYVDVRSVTHNLLRVAMLHFNQSRQVRVMEAMKSHVNFTHAIAMMTDSDVWQKRAEFAARRVRDDDWLFDKFKDSCNV